jgi:hypothetical protein
LIFGTKKEIGTESKEQGAENEKNKGLGGSRLELLRIFGGFMGFKSEKNSRKERDEGFASLLFIFRSFSLPCALGSNGPNV